MIRQIFLGFIYVSEKYKKCHVFSIAFLGQIRYNRDMIYEGAML